MHKPEADIENKTELFETPRKKQITWSSPEDQT